MDIHSPKGTKIVYAYPNNGWDYDVKRAAEHLTVGETYTVARIEVGNSTSYVTLEEKPDYVFNTVQFSHAKPAVVTPPQNETQTDMRNATLEERIAFVRKVHAGILEWCGKRRAYLQGLELPEDHSSSWAADPENPQCLVTEKIQNALNELMGLTNAQNSTEMLDAVSDCMDNSGTYLEFTYFRSLYGEPTTKADQQFQLGQLLAYEAEVRYMEALLRVLEDRSPWVDNTL